MIAAGGVGFGGADLDDALVRHVAARRGSGSTRPPERSPPGCTSTTTSDGLAALELAGR